MFGRPTFLDFGDFSVGCSYCVIMWFEIYIKFAKESKKSFSEKKNWAQNGRHFEFNMAAKRPWTKKGQNFFLSPYTSYNHNMKSNFLYIKVHTGPLATSNRRQKLLEQLQKMTS